MKLVDKGYWINLVNENTTLSQIIFCPNFNFYYISHTLSKLYIYKDLSKLYTFINFLITKYQVI